jgi:hypothetical protein
VTRYDPTSIWDIDMVIYHIDMVILDIDTGYGLIIWEMAVSIRSSPRSIWDILSLWLGGEQQDKVRRVLAEAWAPHQR